MYTVPRYLPTLGLIASGLVVQAKQHVIAPDMCAYVSSNLYRLVGITANTINSIRGDIDVCLCQSSVDGARGFVATNPIAQLAANDYEFGVGEDKVINALMYYIASQGSTCTYPENAIPICVEELPCDFGCSHGFTRVGDSCACPATMHICGGHCQVDYCTNSSERAAYEKALKLKALEATKTTQQKKKKKGKRSPAPSKRAPIPAPSKRAPIPAPSKRAPAPAPAPVSKRAPAPSKRAPAPSKRAPAPSKRAPQPSKRAPQPSKRAPQPSKRAPQPSKRAPAPVLEPGPELFDLDARAVENYDDQEFDEYDDYDFDYEERDEDEDEDDEGEDEYYTEHEEAPIFERDQMRILREDRCRAGQSLCGAWRKGVDEWECLDTRTTLDSCGGCIYPYYLDENSKVGVDCSSLPGVVGVECRNSSCFVHSCAEGYVLSPAMDECIHTH